MPKKRRRSLSPVRKEQLVKDFHRSELSAAAFCRKRRVCYTSFLNWKREAEIPSKTSTALQAPRQTQFVELELTPATDPVPTPRVEPVREALVAELVIGSGVALRVYGPGTSRTSSSA